MILLSDPCSIASRPGIRELGFSGVQALGIRFDPAATIRVPVSSRYYYYFGIMFFIYVDASFGATCTVRKEIILRNRYLSLML